MEIGRMLPFWARSCKIESNRQNRRNQPRRMAEAITYQWGKEAGATPVTSREQKCLGFAQNCMMVLQKSLSRIPHIKKLI